eukprot:TRINITY_DN317_c0_g1_i1.p1 TRINITY_DN317_c0_g1~~TRINITY_DN317_c0_g1_i1.p1  ORF type:complete len:218 (-),score=93.94 TRINITY_DN317_c0_g1_i1:1448-2101(-)
MSVPKSGFEVVSSDEESDHFEEFEDESEDEDEREGHEEVEFVDINTISKEKIDRKEDHEAMKSKLEAILLPHGKSGEVLIISGPRAEISDVFDDKTRENVMYESAVSAVKDALQKLDESGFPHQRPDDYFAEMVKSDDHMRKIKAKLLEEKTQIEDAQERRRVREQKKFGKKVQREKRKEKMDKKKKSKDEAAEWKKRQKRGGNRGGNEPERKRRKK